MQTLYLVSPIYQRHYEIFVPDTFAPPALLLFRPCCAAARPRIRSRRAVGCIYCVKLCPQVAGESVVVEIGRSNRALECYAGKAGAKVKSSIPNAGNSIRYSVTVFLCLPISTLYYS